MLVATNPFNGTAIDEYESFDTAAMNNAIDRAHSAFNDWSESSFATRAKVLKRVATCLRGKKKILAQLMAEEMGKPIKEGMPEVEKAAWCAEYYAEHAEHYLQTEVLPSDASRSYVCYQPLGTVLGILPWNAPVWLAFRFLAPTLMAGNTAVMKHDPNVPGCAAVIAEVFSEAEAPPYIMQNLPLTTPQVEQAIKHADIAAVSFTGSSAAGAKVASMAGSVIKPCVLELGGSDPCIVCADADLERAADVATLSRIINAGQSCIAAKRIIVEESVYDTFIQLLLVRLKTLQLGNPLNESTDVGPIARQDLRLNLHRQVLESVEAGARCLLGGTLLPGDGFFYPVTLLADLNENMCAFKEETFGPVMAVAKAKDLDHALEQANRTDFGLGAAIWMADQTKAEEIALRINAGQVAINGIVKTDPRLPSGGIKRSGFGRELGPHGIKEFVNAKQIWIK